MTRVAAALPGGVIIRRHERMYGDEPECFYYLTLYNENYPMPMPEGMEEDRSGLAGSASWPGPTRHRAQIRCHARALGRRHGRGT